MLPGEAVAFIARRTGRSDDDAARSLAETLGYLPLALEQACAYMEETGADVARYLDLFAQRRKELLARASASSDYPDTVATTWELAIDRAGSSAAELLNLFAFLAPDDIPLDVLRPKPGDAPQGLPPDLADPVVFDEALGSILRYSLAEVAGQICSVHRLVQAVARDRMTADQAATAATSAVTLVNGAFPFDSDDVRTWGLAARLLPHALAVTAYAEAMSAPPLAAGRLLNQAGLYMKGRAQFTLAKATFAQALAIAQAAYGPDHPTVATVVNNLGNLLRDLGDLAGARAAYERALRIDEAAYGPDHPEVAIRVNNLGLVLRALGDLAGARAAYQRALRIDEAAYGPDHPEVATDVNNLGGVLRDLGDLAGARAAFERALRIGEATYGPDHPEVARDVNNLGNVLRDLGDLAGARAALERALRIDEAAYGPDHPTVAIRVNNLGGVLQDLGDLAGARAAYVRALRTFETLFGESHPCAATVRRNLASLTG